MTLRATFDPAEVQSKIIDLFNSPLHDLSFEEVIEHRLSELLEKGEEARKSKFSVYADGKLRQAVAIVQNHRQRFSTYEVRYILFKHGGHIILQKFSKEFERSARLYNIIIHGDDDDKATDVSNPGKCTLSQCVDARNRAGIQLYVTPAAHSGINDISTRLGVSMSDYVVICLWESILTSDAPIPSRLIEHGKNLLDEFRRKIDKRLNELERLSSIL